MVAFAAFYFAENAACFAEAFRQAMLRRGVPRCLYCDNGATYRTHHLPVVCATLNVTLIHRFLQDAAQIRPAPDDLDALMRMKLARKVGMDRTVQLQGRLYEAPDGYAGETVTVLFDPFDPTRPVSMCRKGETTARRDS